MKGLFHSDTWMMLPVTTLPPTVFSKKIYWLYTDLRESILLWRAGYVLVTVPTNEDRKPYLTLILEKNVRKKIETPLSTGIVGTATNQ